MAQLLTVLAFIYSKYKYIGNKTIYTFFWSRQGHRKHQVMCTRPHLKYVRTSTSILIKNNIILNEVILTQKQT